MGAWQPIIRRRGVSVLFQSYINQGYKNAYYQEILGVSRGLGSHRYVDGWVIVNSEESTAFIAEFVPRLDEPAYVDYFLSRCKQVSDELLATGATVRAKEYEGVGNAELLLDFMTFSSRSVRIMPFLNTMVFVQDAIEERVRDSLGRHYGFAGNDPTLLARMQQLMAEGSRIPLASQALTELGRLADRVRVDHPGLAERLRTAPDLVTRAELEDVAPTVAAAFDRYLEEYDFLETNYYLGSPTSFTELCRQVGSLEPKAGASVAREVDETELGPSDRRLLHTAQHLQYLREFRLEALYKAGRDCRGLLTRIGEAVGTSYEETVYMTFEEIQESLTTREPAVDLATISSRVAGYASRVEGEEEEFVVGAAIEPLRADLPESTSGGQSLSGTTAYPGDHVGPARIVGELAQVQNVMPGDVLVAPMTMPYHVPAMARAGAVITDEGGILSHAAIVARELRIPCVVGLGEATSAFRDGEELHVCATPSGGSVRRVGA